jgi:hypothetical protein
MLFMRCRSEKMEEGARLSLTSLDLSCCQGVSGAALARLLPARCPALTTLHLSSCGGGEEEEDGGAGAAHITTIGVSETDLARLRTGCPALSLLCCVDLTAAGMDRTDSMSRHTT